MLIGLVILVLGQVVPPPPPVTPGPTPTVGYPAYPAPTVQIQQAQPAGTSSTAYVVVSVVGSLAVALSGGGAVVAFVQARAARAAKQMDVQAETARQLPAVLAEVRKTDREDIKRLWDKCDQQDVALKALDARCELIRGEKHDCVTKLDAANFRVLRLEGEKAALGTQLGQCQHAFKALKAIHDRCPKPRPAAGPNPA